MDPDAILDWILRLRDAIDAAIDAARPIDDDAVYTLVGLIAEIDVWLATGRELPSRWARAGRDSSHDAPFVLHAEGPSNDAAPGVLARRRRARVTARGSNAQLALPFQSRA